MINWFKKRKTNKEIEKFERLLSDKLGELYPDMKELRDNSRYLHSNFTDKPQGFAFVYSMNGPYYERHGKKHRIHFKFDGLELKKKESSEYIKLPITVHYNLISNVEIETPADFWKNLDYHSIKLVDYKRTEFTFANDDEKKLRKILKDIDEEIKSKIEVNDTYEIELDGKRYYTILDMEDGNYIGVNSKGQVFRLHHDSDEQAKLINKSVKDFLTSYSGDKKEFADLFN
jgi:hypothetical protein